MLALEGNRRRDKLVVVKRVQEEFKVDIFGFGVEFHKNIQINGKRLEMTGIKSFLSAEFQINVNTKIIRTGLINTPYLK